ncbi:MAG: glycerol-1-phosphate dehydrogenase [Cenarchaeum symbiont of Oopsacas minuta]|nr:glycerol-1-phosphate dehydrogenase [Cenarchaeum symbiont of Oopsacas minuta]
MGEIGEFLSSLTSTSIISVVTGPHVGELVRQEFEESLSKSGKRCRWHVARGSDEESMKDMQSQMAKDVGGLIVGIGGGRAVDTAKMIGYGLHTPFVSVPTAASHDGIASPFVSVKAGQKPHSIVASAPLGVFVDIGIIEKAPPRLLASGCGDLIANIIAVHDWQLGRDKTGEYYGRYSASLALLSARIVMEEAEMFAKDGLDARIIVEALISAGVAACIAGSSRPCSGSEHLFSHALDRLAPGVGLHGEKCGIGSIMMAKLQNQDWKKIADTLRCVGAPTDASGIGLEKDLLVDALVEAQQMRPERYTILKKVKMTPEKALNLAKETSVL